MAEEEEDSDKTHLKLLSSYLGLSFSLYLASLPSYKTQLSELQSKLATAEDQLRQMKSRRKEDSKANARVVDIFASHRNAWQVDERRLLEQLDAAEEEIGRLRVKVEELEGDKCEVGKRVEELERDVREREEIMIGFMGLNRSDNGCEDEEVEEEEEEKGERDGGGYGSSRECYVNNGGLNYEDFMYGQHGGSGGSVGFGSEFLGSEAVSKFWAERATLWQDVRYEPLESLYDMKHFVARRESPWKVDGGSTGVSSKLKLLEQELLNLEKVSNGDLSKVPLVMRKQAKRYQALAGKIDDLCRRMQASDPCEPTLSPEFRTQRQTDFLLEAFRLQQRAAETNQKFIALQTEIGKSNHGGGDEIGNQAKLTMGRSMDFIKMNLKEIQRNLEIWLARIIGDLEGLLARDGTSRVREYYSSRYPFVQ
ncbi:hypothetical protein ACFE04_021995 [Oxalis oulophora]